jgi:hypothetical protein
MIGIVIIIADDGKEELLALQCGTRRGRSVLGVDWTMGICGMWRSVPAV